MTFLFFNYQTIYESEILSEYCVSQVTSWSKLFPEQVSNTGCYVTVSSWNCCFVKEKIKIWLFLRTYKKLKYYLYHITERSKNILSFDVPITGFLDVTSDFTKQRASGGMWIHICLCDRHLSITVAITRADNTIRLNIVVQLIAHPHSHTYIHRHKTLALHANASDVITTWWAR